jgi:hypothetical protein
MDHAEVVDADGEPVDLSLPQPEAPAEGPAGMESDGPVVDEPDEAPEAPVAAHEEPAQ